ncbi:MAG: hypothetical protein JST45_00885 [Bacteroidetes bacterium]|nr:hypothetical protein [Bacteroidota bacterium]
MAVPSAMGQWALGPRADLALFRGFPRYIAYGIGASATYSPRKRNHWTADATYHFPHLDHYIRVQGPRNLATGDTTSSTWRSTLHTSHVSVLIGFQRSFNRRPKPMEWYCTAASGFAFDRHRTEGEVTYKYSGVQARFDHSDHSTYIPFLAGAGRIWHQDHADLSLEAATSVTCYSIMEKDLGLRFRDYSLFMTFRYCWRL